MKPQTIDNYRLTSLEEPTDEMLAQIMHEAAEEAARTNREATRRFFEEIKQASAAFWYEYKGTSPSSYHYCRTEWFRCPLQTAFMSMTILSMMLMHACFTVWPTASCSNATSTMSQNGLWVFWKNNYKVTVFPSSITKHPPVLLVSEHRTSTEIGCPIWCPQTPKQELL